MATARTPRMTGAFQGAMPRTTPTGWRTRHRRQPRLVRGDDFAGDLRGDRRGFAQHASRKKDVEMRPAGGRPGLLGHRPDEVRRAPFKAIGGAKQSGATLAGTQRRPGGEGLSGRGHRIARIGDGRRGGEGCDFARHRIEALERSAVRGRDVPAPDH